MSQATPEAPHVVAVDLGFRYGRPVLEEFSLTAGPGEIVLLLGLNGAGKTTALKLLSGQLPAKSGSRRILGKDPSRASGRRHLFFLQEVAEPPTHLSARETVGFHLDLYGRRGGRRQRVKECLQRLDLIEVADKRASTFSKGMRRRLELACLLAVDPEVWILDEPQAGLDPRGLRLLRELCLEARERGRTLLIASHALGDVPTLADRVLVLSRGRTTFSGDRATLRAATGARSFVVRGGDEAFDAAMSRLADEHGVELEGPEIAPRRLEEMLFERDAPA